MDALSSNASRSFTAHPSSLDNDSQLFHPFSASPCFPDSCNSSVSGTNQRYTNASSVDAETDDDGTVRPMAELVLLGILAGSTVAVTIAGNFVVLFSFLLESSIRQPTNYFIASLAVSDLLIGTISMPFYTVYLLAGKSWPLGEVLCDLWLSVDYTVCLSSIYTVLCITIDRFCSIKVPAKYRKWRTERKVTTIIGVVWTIPILVFFPSIFGWQYFVGVRTVAKGRCYVQYMENAVFNVLLQLAYFWITMIVMCSLYSGIYKVALNLQRKSEAKWRQTKSSLVSVAGQTVKQLGIRVEGETPEEGRPGGDGGSQSEEGIASESGPKQEVGNAQGGFRGNGVREQRSSECSSDTDAGEGKGQATSGAKCRQSDRRHQTQKKEIIVRKLSWKQRHTGKKALAKSQSVLPNMCRPLLPLMSSIPPQPRMLLSPPVSSGIDGQHPLPDDQAPAFSAPSRTVSLKSSRSGLSNGLNIVVLQRRASDCFPPLTPIMPPSLPHRSDIAPKLRPEDGNIGQQETRPHPNISCIVLNDDPNDDVTCQSFNRRGSTTWRTRSSQKHQLMDNNSLESIEPLDAGVCGRRGSATPDSPVWIRRSSIVLKPPKDNSSSDSRCTIPQSKSQQLDDDDAEIWSKRVNGGSSYDEVEASVEKESDVRTTVSFGSFLRRRRAKFRKTLSTRGTHRRSHTIGRCWSTSRLFCLRRRRVSVVPDQRSVGGTSGAPPREPSKRENRARKALRTITIILGAFVVCWTPWHILSMIYGFCPMCVDNDLYDVSYWLCYLNSPINPFCYAFANPQFKKTFLRIFRLDWRRL